MKILMINGSPNEFGCTKRALTEITTVLNKNNIDFEFYEIGKKPQQGCIACRKCRETSKCVFDDDVNKIVSRLNEFDGIIIGSPVYYASASGQLISFLDRLFFVGGSKMHGKLGACVVSCRRGGASSTFDQLNKYFSICNMVIVTSQYWNQVHGSKMEDVNKDEEGLQTMRTLAQNFSWLLKSIEAGKKSGIEFPKYEEHLWTNFVK